MGNGFFRLLALAVMGLLLLCRSLLLLRDLVGWSLSGMGQVYREGRGALGERVRLGFAIQ